MISQTAARAAICEVFDEPLSKLGYERVDDKKWVNSEAAPIRRVINLQALKGGTIYPRPYFSLDFVPHESGGRLRWHRTPKTTMCDVCIDPMDFGNDAPRYFLDYYPQPPERHRIEKVLKRVRKKLIRDLGQVRQVSELVAVLDRLKATKPRRFGYHNYIQHPISAAFIYAKLGQEEKAREELEKWHGLEHLISTDRKRLDRLFGEALAEGRA